MSTLCTDPNTGGLNAAIADRFAREDAERSAMLDGLIKSGRRCRLCGARLSEAVLSRHPGVCGSKACVRQAEAEVEEARVVETSAREAPPALPPAEPEEPAKPAEETEMACPKCKSPSRHKADCPNNPEKKSNLGNPEAAAPSPAPKARAARAPRSGTGTARPHETKTNAEILAAIREHEVELVTLRAELRARRDEIAVALGEDTRAASEEAAA
jgi:hypothetical protein